VDGLYSDILMVAIGMLNGIIGWVLTRLVKKVDDLNDRIHETVTSVAVLTAQLKAKNVINGEKQHVKSAD